MMLLSEVIVVRLYYNEIFKIHTSLMVESVWCCVIVIVASSVKFCETYVGAERMPSLGCCRI